jgi:hypothetical protein
MAKDNKADKGKDTQQKDLTWVWFAVVIVLIGAFVYIRYQSSQVFEYVGGDDRSVLVLLRGTKDISYQVQYTGNNLISIERIQLKLITGQDMQVYTDVEEMRLVNGGLEVTLDMEGNVLAGDTFVVQPGDTFVIHMRLYGQALGTNRLESLIISYLEGDREGFFDLNLEAAAFAVE